VREGLNRLWLVLVLAAFGVPLFVGLGSTDLANDEAIYSYAVESVLTTGDWLSPLASPSTDHTFLEKPPLKFWIVATPIHFGLLPYNEFSLRVWDAVFGTLAFVYVFLIGRRLAGPICGLVAVLVLFAHTPLIFDHGFRSNNMDAALVLAYCGGVYHYLRWSSAGAASGRAWHIVAVAGWFFLGFMTKFVAVLFLPAVIGVAALVLPAQRRQLARDWWRWIAAGIAALACGFPWFYYQYTLHGRGVWRIMFGEHVVQRFTTFTDPGHVQPWYFYISAAYTELVSSGSILWVGLGLAVLLGQTIRRRTPERVVVILWLVLPVTLISTGTSKLYHYLYPFLPPLALAAGAGVAWIFAVANARIGARAWLDWRPSRWLRAGAWALTCAALAIAVATLIEDGVRFYVGEHLIFRNTSHVRPLMIGLIGIALAAGVRAGAAVTAVLILQMILPTPLNAYELHLRRLKFAYRPLGALADCLRHVDAAEGRESVSVYAPIANDAFLHPYFYYLRGTGWEDGRSDDERLRAALLPEGEPRPVVIDIAGYEAFLARVGQKPRLALVTNLPYILVLLPGPYRVCSNATEFVGR
jgi:4-amino-4-deoxy-L-arabinose transferase-like glycosyltransferase